jgi:hypothetical protein
MERPSEKRATARTKQNSYRYPVDRFFLVAGPRPKGETVYLNVADSDASAGAVVGARRRRFGRAPSESRFTRRSRREAGLDCYDKRVPSHDGGATHTCAEQKRWGKCDEWFMENGGYCRKTCGKCVNLFEDADALSEYDDAWYDQIAFHELFSGSVNDAMEEAMEFGVEDEDEEDGDAPAPAPAPATEAMARDAVEEELAR